VLGEGVNPADFMIDYISADNKTEDSKIQSRDKIVALSNAYDASCQQASSSKEPVLLNDEESSVIIQGNRERLSWTTEFFILTRRALGLVFCDAESIYSCLGKRIVPSVLMQRMRVHLVTTLVNGPIS
jgi:hypothetical protein